MSPAPPVIVWFRQDLREKDNPALHEACKSGGPVLPVYIRDDEAARDWKPGAASRWWLHHSLKALNKDIGGNLVLRKGRALDVLLDLVEESGAGAVYWNRCYEPWRIARDKDIKAALSEKRIAARSFNGGLLFEPHQTLKKDGTPYRVFTPYYKKGCLEKAPPPRAPLPAPKKIDWYKGKGCALDELELMPDIQWYKGLQQTWTPGGKGAEKRLEDFLNEGIAHYKEGRNYPARHNISRLSPHLHFGEISPHMIWEAVNAQELLGGAAQGAATFKSELGWREFCHNLLYYFPDFPEKPMQEKFKDFPWRNSAKDLKAWQQGKTGYPLIDAGMRELWQTGYMHNRVRMIVGSFLVKNLLIHWHEGQKWFWDTLVDADLANNSANWQWIAGCGADAAPYFRIFNPVTQSEKFDAKGEYIRCYVPELAKMPDKHIHRPWKAPEDVLKAAGVEIGTDYPEPIVDLKATRERALAAYQSIKTKG